MGIDFQKKKKRNPARQESSPTGNLKTLKKNFRDSNDTDSTRLMLIRLPRSCKEGRRIRTLRFNSSDQRQWSKSGLMFIIAVTHVCGLFFYLVVAEQRHFIINQKGLLDNFYLQSR